MQRPSKEKIIAVYNRLAKEQGGKPIGERVFKRETGFAHYYWQGGYWRSWSAFQADAGYAPNSPTQKISDEILLHRFAELALERNEIPSEADLMLKRQEDPSFPSKAAFRRWGGRDPLRAKVAEYCEGKEKFAPVLALLAQGVSNNLDRRLDSPLIICVPPSLRQELQAWPNKCGRATSPRTRHPAAPETGYGACD